MTAAIAVEGLTRRYGAVTAADGISFSVGAGEIFGGGTNAFSRYETGKTKPPVALVKLLKVLYHHPELLQEVRAA